MTNFSHTWKCHCGKPAKFHVILDSERCGNMCGIHARKWPDKGEVLQVCDWCHEHTRGGVSVHSLRGDGLSRFYCRNCESHRYDSMTQAAN